MLSEYSFTNALLMKYFTLTELTRSATGQKAGIDNTPTPQAIANLQILVENTLDPLRELWGRPLRVNSGYRCPELNRLVNGSSNSSHMSGCAADITTGSREGNKILWSMLVSSDIPYSKIIDEQDLAWIHVSYIRGNNRREKLKAIKQNGKWRYYFV